MNALAIVEPAATPVGFPEWVATGRDLLQARTELDWQLADWIAAGKKQFGHQLEFDLLADELGIAPKTLKEAAQVATALPAHLRDSSLSFQHHKAVAGLPTDEALALLKRAKADHLDDRETRIEAVKRRAEISPGFLPDVDWEDVQYRNLVRRWNAATPDVRQMLIDQYEETGLKDIEL